MSSASRLRMSGLMLSGPAALCGFRFCSSLRTPGSVTWISWIPGIAGYCDGNLLWVMAERGSGDAGVKTDWNVLLRICALSLGLLWRRPSSRSDDIPVLSVLRFLIYLCVKPL